MNRRSLAVVTAGAVALPAVFIPGRELLRAVPVQQSVQAPRFTVDPLWPKPLPNHWLLGSATGVAVDSRDHVFVLNNPNSFNQRTEVGGATKPPTGNCCFPAPPVLEFDPAGNLVASWGGPGQGYDWPTAPSGLSIDDHDNVWIGGGGVTDGQALEFTHDGKFLLQIGKPVAVAASPAPAAPGDPGYPAGVTPGAAPPAGRGGGRGGGGVQSGPVTQPAGNSVSTETLGAPARFGFDRAANEVFIADGYRNRRIVVADMTTGKIKRSWGASAKQPSDTNLTAMVADAMALSADDYARICYQRAGEGLVCGAGGRAADGRLIMNPRAKLLYFLRSPSCAAVARDGLLYICDRGNDRIQEFRKDGAFVADALVAAATRGEGSVWDIAFSRDPAQAFLYVADGMNARIRILDRKSLTELSSFGDGGRYPGQFVGVNSVATDSKGNLYTAETYEGKRVQKFDFKGVGPVTKRDQGTVWP